MAPLRPSSTRSRGVFRKKDVRDIGSSKRDRGGEVSNTVGWVESSRPATPAGMVGLGDSTHPTGDRSLLVGDPHRRGPGEVAVGLLDADVVIMGLAGRGVVVGVAELHLGLSGLGREDILV